MIRRSIRRQLPLTYAGIALLAALALGGILLATLHSFYGKRERDYLYENAQVISFSLSRIHQAGLSDDVLRSQIENFAFLSQTRVRLFDVNEQLIFETEAPRPTQISFFSRAFNNLTPNVRQVEAATSITSTQWINAIGGTTDIFATFNQRIPITAGISFFIGEPGQLLTTTQTITTLQPGMVVQRVVQRDDLIDPGPTNDIVFVDALPIVPTAFGFDLGADPNVIGPRSADSVRLPFLDSENQTLGYVELSQGPAYGVEILDAVTIGWLIAGSVAVILAALVGWLISRRISAPLIQLAHVTSQMAEGDLSARADVSRQDEVGTLARSFNDMAGRVEETIVTLRRFVADAAHELHTPLTALRTNLELATSDTQSQTDFVQRAQIQADRLETLVEGLLDLSRIEVNIEEHTILDLRELVQQTSELYASRAEQNGVAFELDLPSQGVEVHGHAVRLRRALGNLMDNALKFTPPGGMIHVGVRAQDESIELRVDDTGIGIPADDLPQLFERFHRGRNAAAYPGNGLGLAIVKAIIDEHHGQMYAENLTPGTRLTIRLPR